MLGHAVLVGLFFLVAAVDVLAMLVGIVLLLRPGRMARVRAVFLVSGTYSWWLTSSPAIMPSSSSSDSDGGGASLGVVFLGLLPGRLG